MRGSAITLMLIVIIIVLITAVIVAWTVMNTMGFFEMKRLYDMCPNKTVYELGVLIEKWHGIG